MGRRDRAGSVLVEAMVATAIVAMILLGVLRVVGDSLARRHAVETKRMALMIARSQLAAAGYGAALAEGERTGEEGDYVWRTHVNRCEDQGASSKAGRLYCVSVAVSPRDGDRTAPVILATRRLAPEA